MTTLLIRAEKSTNKKIHKQMSRGLPRDYSGIVPAFS